MLLSLLAPLALLPFSLATKHSVKVGGPNGEVVFYPNNVTAAVRDTIEFSFYPQNHSIAESDYNNPCKAKTGGIFSGFFVVPSGVSKQIFTVTVNDTNTRWIYCSQISHCQRGMTFVINPPLSGPNTLQAYTDAAARVIGITSQDHVSGGVVSNNDTTATSSSSAASSASSASSATRAATGSTTSGTTTATGTAASASPTGGAGQTGVGAGLGALGLLGLLVGGMI